MKLFKTLFLTTAVFAAQTGSETNDELEFQKMLDAKIGKCRNT